MTTLTPQQIHEAANRLFAVDCDYPAISHAIYVLRTAADQLESRNAFDALRAMGAVR